MKNPFRPSLLKDLRKGVHGARLVFPGAVKEEVDKQFEAGPIEDPERGALWWFLFRSDVRFDLTAEREPQLRAAAHDFAKGMFEQVSLHTDSEVPLRSADPEWSPVVDLQLIELGTAPALRLIHRMIYRPGREMIMGHLVVPLRKGLFECQVLTDDTFTGTRESMLVADRLRHLSEAERRAFEEAVAQGSARLLTQSEIDAPELDERFPKHCLSRARAALRWLERASGLEIREPWTQPHGTREIALPDLGASIVPPPGFVHHSGERFERVSFCATDGCEQLVVGPKQHIADRVAADRLEEFATAKARWMLSAMHLADIHLELEPDRAADEPIGIAADCMSVYGRSRNVFVFFRDTGGRARYLWLSTIPARPAEVLIDELRACASSWRPTA